MGFTALGFVSITFGKLGRKCAWGCLECKGVDGWMELKMEATIIGYIILGVTGYMLGLYEDNGKEHGKYYNGSYTDY